MKPVKKINLYDQWKVYTHKAPDNSSIHDTSVPCSVFDILLENGEIEDPFHGLNEHSMKWIYDSDWEFSTTISISP